MFSPAPARSTHFYKAIWWQLHMHADMGRLAQWHWSGSPHAQTWLLCGCALGGLLPRPWGDRDRLLFRPGVLLHSGAL
jgi:hypothetical protein